jgi:hypothetical protein
VVTSANTVAAIESAILLSLVVLVRSLLSVPFIGIERYDVIPKEAASFRRRLQGAVSIFVVRVVWEGSIVV